MRPFGWIVVGAVVWTILIGVVATTPPPEILHACGPVLPFDEAGCQRSIAEAKAADAEAQRVGAIELGLLWVAGMVVAGSFTVVEIKARRSPK